MTLTIVHKLALLANREIVGTENQHASEVRAQIVADIFPLLSEDERIEIANRMEEEEIFRSLKAKHGDKYPDEEYERATQQVIQLLREGERRINEAEAAGFVDPEPE